ncbi:Hypothetical protein, putative [Bodo saltans]|uniref:Uncharacterized protein n=1 Tax=Bodo saltans TaxID=75058 RepID=A0A0S4ISM2_BODSA|nr:Hypothetical protein, putative [Bodo saltans]|eukprot:CUF65316.1 Hypothetical protein, putative [Bodo saltans]
MSATTSLKTSPSQLNLDRTASSQSLSQAASGLHRGGIDPEALLQQVSSRPHSTVHPPASHPPSTTHSVGIAPALSNAPSQFSTRNHSRASSRSRSGVDVLSQDPEGEHNENNFSLADERLGPIPRPLLPLHTSGHQVTTGGSATVFAGVLFPSFDAEANYHAKQAELRALGFDLDDPVDTERQRSSSRAADHHQSAEHDDAAADLKVIERQIKRRDELYVAAQRRADEAKEYAAMVTHLRAEAKRSEVIRKDVHSSLVSQVEALQYVVQRRNDADNQTAKVRFVDVENEVITVSKEVDEEAEEQLKRIGRLGEDTLKFIEQLSAQATEFVRDHQNGDVLEVELRETQAVLLQQVVIRVSMLSDRVRSDAIKFLSNDMRTRYTVVPTSTGHGSAAHLTPELRSILSAYGSSDAATIVEQLRGPMHTSLQDVVKRTWAGVTADAPANIDATLRAVESVAVDVLEDAVRMRVVELETETSLLLKHLREGSASSDQRRIQEEHALRDVVLDMGKLLETQRLAMNDLRTQLLLQAKVAAIASSPPQRSQRHKSKSPATARSRAASASKSGGGRNPRQASPATSRRLLFEPLSEEQIKSLYGALPTQATVVEEVSVERLSRITSKAQLNKKVTPHEQDQLILLSRQPASLIGRGSSQKVLTTLTAPAGPPAHAKPKSTTTTGAIGKGIQQQTKLSNPQNVYNTGELATLQELRRLRVKLDR